jgi:hypothetical protein
MAYLDKKSGVDPKLLKRVGDKAKAIKKKKVPKGYHRMPDGSLMKGDSHKG